MDLYREMLGCGLDFEGTSEDTQTEPPPAPSAPPATTLTITGPPSPVGIPEHDRSDWRHWINEDGDYQNARHEVLIAESLDQVAFETDRQCRAGTGQWYGAFTGGYFHHNTLSNWVKHGQADVAAGKPSTAYARFTKQYLELVAEHCGKDSNRNREFDRALEILERTCECGNDKVLMPDGRLGSTFQECTDLDTRQRRRPA